MNISTNKKIGIKISLDTDFLWKNSDNKTSNLNEFEISSESLLLTR